MQKTSSKQKSDPKSELNVLILAAGLGKRMHSSTPKVLHPLLYKPMLHWVIETSLVLNPKKIAVIIGHQADEIKKSCRDYKGLEFFLQSEQLGTGHAVQQALPFIQNNPGDFLIISGDTPALTPATLQTLIEKHHTEKNALTLLTSKLESPFGYGRILRKGKKIVSIREQKDCSTKEAKINEINTGLYCFSQEALLNSLGKLKNSNAQSEFYLTDTLEILAKAKRKIGNHLSEVAHETQGINDRAQLAEIQKVLQERINTAWMKKGVTLQDPMSTWICPDTQIAEDVSIENGCILIASKIKKNVYLKQGCRIEHSTVGEETVIGPFAHLRPETVVGDRCKIGNFVEIKKSVLKDEVKASHLSYIGDAEIGERTNLGCGFITCNFDGRGKHKTIIEEGVFVGSDTQVVAPIRIGKGSYIASGTTVTEDVPEESLVLSRGEQITKAGYARKYTKEASKKESK